MLFFPYFLHLIKWDANLTVWIRRIAELAF
jgi:hypothetical protein